MLKINKRGKLRMKVNAFHGTIYCYLASKLNTSDKTSILPVLNFSFAAQFAAYLTY